MTNETTRREALIGIGAVAGLAALPQAACAQPGRKLGYAIVGLGSYATNQIMPSFARCQHSRIAALVSGTSEKLARYGAEYDVPEKNRYSYATFDRIADNPDVDIVYVILPVSMHAEYSIRASKAGKHVMCEKPMAPTARECEAMVAAAAGAGKKLMIGYRSRFQPHNVAAIELCRTKAIGDLKMIRTAHGFPIQPNQWRLDHKMSGGGSMMDIGIYSLQAARYLAGEEPVEVTAVESTDRRDPRFATVEDRIDFTLRFPSGLLASCISSYSSSHNEYRAIGSDGWIELEPATAYRGQAMRVRRNGATSTPNIDTSGPDQFVGQLDHLAQCIRDNRTPIVPGEEGLRDIRIIEAIYRSMREKRAISLT
ncbi:glucose-fructose oxidoreductase [Sphingomonas spermidinifaciens]|uniref:Glucose-fructose oxidoreductase n=1 Tax=Sphingomonas spermidinifaciens TaxID=1141889 RepID=A0A2A4B3T4_9SPHN|nr:Gfo/Idh/MocA family oxidoreductase [Sphingomonas spermidinifaciens]PCD02316.1 glucose-fructose oxidoreductase [Sphingomonas spermidinifaciens]